MYSPGIPTSYVPCMPYPWCPIVGHKWQDVPASRDKDHSTNDVIRTQPGVAQRATLLTDLMEIRQEAVADGMELLTPDEVLAEMRERRGDADGGR